MHSFFVNGIVPLNALEDTYLEEKRSCWHSLSLFQLREEFDSGKDVKLDESHNCHDVGALLKEYFRDLPEALLTRDLYSALVATRSK